MSTETITMPIGFDSDLTSVFVPVQASYFNELLKASEKLEELTKGVTVIVEREIYDTLQKDASWLGALEAAGVDNWDGISNAHDILAEWDGEGED